MDGERELVDRGLGSRLKKRLLDGMIGRAQDQVAAERETVRELQQETGRTQERVIGIHVYETTVQGREEIRQGRFDYSVVIRDGEAVFLEGATTPNIIVRTDVRTVVALLRNRLALDHKGQPRRIISPFKPTDALRMGLIETDGEGTGLRDLILLERTILPKLGPKLGLA